MTHSFLQSPAAGVLTAGAMALAGLLALGWLSFFPSAEATTLALVFPPGLDEDEIFARITAADGRPIRQGASASVMVAAFPTPPGIASLTTMGVLLVLDPLAAQGCAPPSGDTAR
ncbi:hypothetical protein F11_11050 [Rhodospirillum rubrum F11]|nr:hypothetical protein F11_11050 [Rhodospirillum rubrum F11]